jgi:hypothetical protein
MSPTLRGKRGNLEKRKRRIKKKAKKGRIEEEQRGRRGGKSKERGQWSD